MATIIDEAEVRRIAKLARLSLSDAEVRQFSSQLADILEYVRQLDGVDTDDVEPMAHALPIANVLREDTPHAPLDRAAALANAPQRQDAFFKVPAVLDGSGGA